MNRLRINWDNYQDMLPRFIAATLISLLLITWIVLLVWTAVSGQWLVHIVLAALFIGLVVLPLLFAMERED